MVRFNSFGAALIAGAGFTLFTAACAAPQKEPGGRSSSHLDGQACPAGVSEVDGTCRYYVSSSVRSWIAPFDTGDQCSSSVAQEQCGESRYSKTFQGGAYELACTPAANAVDGAGADGDLPRGFSGVTRALGCPTDQPGVETNAVAISDPQAIPKPANTGWEAPGLYGTLTEATQLNEDSTSAFWYGAPNWLTHGVFNAAASPARGEGTIWAKLDARFSCLDGVLRIRDIVAGGSDFPSHLAKLTVESDGGIYYELRKEYGQKRFCDLFSTGDDGWVIGGTFAGPESFDGP